MKIMLQLFNYNSNPVSFRKANDTVYINATEMAKPFGKFVKDWTMLQGTTDFVNAYKSAKGQISLLEIQKGGNAPGSWMHEDLALKSY